MTGSRSTPLCTSSSELNASCASTQVTAAWYHAGIRRRWALRLLDLTAARTASAGVGTGDYAAEVDAVLGQKGFGEAVAKLPRLVINTHCHFDHIGGEAFARLRGCNPPFLQPVAASSPIPHPILPRRRPKVTRASPHETTAPSRRAGVTGTSPRRLRAGTLRMSPRLWTSFRQMMRRSQRMSPRL